MASSSSRCSSLPRGTPLLSMINSSMLRTVGLAARKSRASWISAKDMFGLPVPSAGLEPSAGNGQQLGQAGVEGAEQQVDIGLGGVRAAQRHVVEWRDQNAAVDQVQVQGHLQLVMESRLG